MKEIQVICVKSFIAEYQHICANSKVKPIMTNNSNFNIPWHLSDKKQIFSQLY